VLSRTIHIGNPSKLRLSDRQLIVEQEGAVYGRVPIEDLGLVVVDHPQVTFTAALFRQLSADNVTVLFCDEGHHPSGIFQPYSGHTLLTGNVQQQINATNPLRKQLWKQTVEAKIGNQAALMKRRGLTDQRLLHLIREVRSGDTSNREAAAAAHYWKHLFGQYEILFRRDRYGAAPNNLLNYCYAVIRSTVAKSIVGAGLLPMLGIDHRNSLNAFCLADDLMEPYRPFADSLVLKVLDTSAESDIEFLTKPIKQELLSISVMDVVQKEQLTPLMVAIERTCTSLARCFSGEKRRISYATFNPL
jgi:CRISP-associated protein Cas1